MNVSQKVATGGIIAALYIILTYFAEMMGLASGAIQVRFSEALTVLPCLTPVAVPGLAIGCFLANLLTGCAPWDVVFGSLATLLGALGTYALRSRPYLAWLPPVISNTLIAPGAADIYRRDHQLWLSGFSRPAHSKRSSVILNNCVILCCPEITARIDFLCR